MTAHHTGLPTPTLRTARLVLRAPQDRDMESWQTICERLEVARETLRMPHPYPPGGAAEWLRWMREAHSRGERQSFMMLDGSGTVVGVTSLDINPEHRHAELAYALAVEEWGKGYATEAAREVTRFGFETLGLERIHAGYYTRNPASGRVLEKLGFIPEGVRPRMYRRFGEWLDLALVRLLREEWDAARSTR